MCLGVLTLRAEMYLVGIPQSRGVLFARVAQSRASGAEQQGT